MRTLLLAKHFTGLEAAKALLNDGAELVAVVAQEQERNTPWFSQLETFLKDNAIPFYSTTRLSRDSLLVDQLQSLKPEIAFTVLFTQIIPASLFGGIPNGLVNFHPSLLPAYRGPHPINWAIIRGETLHGVTAHFVTEAVDAGPILTQSEFVISSTDTNLTVFAKAEVHILEQLKQVFGLALRDELTARPQDEENAFYLPFREPEDGSLNWKDMDAETICNMSRALQPPLVGAYTMFDNVRFTIHKAEVEEVGEVTQPPGTVISTSPDFLVATIKNIVRLVVWETNETRKLLELIIKPGDQFQ